MGSQVSDGRLMQTYDVAGYGLRDLSRCWSSMATNDIPPIEPFLYALVEIVNMLHRPSQEDRRCARDTVCDLSQGLSASLRCKTCSRARISHYLIVSHTSSRVKPDHYVDNIDTCGGSGNNKAHRSGDAKL